MPAVMATLKFDSTAEINASADPTAAFLTDSPTNAIAAFSAPRIKTRSTANPSRSKKPIRQATHTGTNPTVLEATLMGNRVFSWPRLAPGGDENNRGG